MPNCGTPGQPVGLSSSGLNLCFLESLQVPCTQPACFAFTSPPTWQPPAREPSGCPPSTAQQIPVTLASVYHWAGGFSSVIPSSVSQRWGPKPTSVVKCLLRARNFSGWWRYQGGGGGAPALRQIAPSSRGEVGWGKFSEGDTEDLGGSRACLALH